MCYSLLTFVPDLLSCIAGKLFGPNVVQARISIPGNSFQHTAEYTPKEDLPTSCELAYERICTEAGNDKITEWTGKSYFRRRTRKGRPYMSDSEEDVHVRKLINAQNMLIANQVLDPELPPLDYMSPKRIKRLSRRAEKLGIHCESTLRDYIRDPSQVHEDYTREERRAYYELLDREKIRKQKKKRQRKAKKAQAQFEQNSNFVSGSREKFSLDELHTISTEAFGFFNGKHQSVDDDDNYDDPEQIGRLWTYENLSKKFRSGFKGFNVAPFDIQREMGPIMKMWDAFKGYCNQVGTNIDKMVDGNEWNLMVGVYLLQMMRSTNIVDDVLATTQFFLGSKLAGKMEVLPKEVILLLISLNYARRVGFKSKQDADLIATEAADELDSARIGAASFLSSHFVEALRNIVLILVSYKLFSKDVAKHMHLWLGKVDKPKSIPEAMSKITTSIADLLRMGEKVIEGAPLSTVFLAEDPNKKVMKTGRELKAAYSLLYYGLPVEGHTCAKVWMNTARETVTVIQWLLKKANPYDSRTKELATLQSELTAQIADVGRLSQRQKRATPYGVVVHGEPGIGKSSILTLINQIWSSVKGRTFEQSHQFERVMSSQYWDGYDPWSNPIIHYSEVGSFTKKIAEAGQDIVVKELLGVIDSLPYCVDMSGVNDKGKVYCLAEMVIIDTNNEEMNLKHIVQNPAAFRRRLLYIKPIVKREFKKGNGSLDATIPSDDYMDKWLFEVYEKIPNGNVDSETNLLMTGEADNQNDIYSLERLLRAHMSAHIEREERVKTETSKNWLEVKADKIREIQRERFGDEEKAPYVAPPVVPPVNPFINHDLEPHNIPVPENDWAYDPPDEKVQAVLDENDAWNAVDPLEMVWNVYAEAEIEHGVHCHGDVLLQMCTDCAIAQSKRNKEERDYDNWFRQWVLVKPKEAVCHCCPGGKHIGPNDVKICKCCPEGIHVPDKRYKFFCDSFEHGFKLVTSAATMLFFCFSDAINIFNDFTWPNKIWAFWTLFLMAYHVPETRIPLAGGLAYASCCALLQYGLQQVGHKVSQKVYEKGYSYFNDRLDKAKGYVMKDMNKIIRYSSYIVGILAAIKLAAVVFDLLSTKVEGVSEADYQTPGEDFNILRRMEDEYECTPSFHRVKGKLPEMAYDNSREVEVCNFTSGNLKEFHNGIRKNVRTISVFDETREMWRSQHALGIKGQYVITNYHSMSGVGRVHYKMSMSSHTLDKNGNPIRPFEGFVSRDAIIQVSSDIVMFKVEGQTFTDISKYFPEIQSKHTYVEALINGDCVYASSMNQKTMMVSDMGTRDIQFENPIMYKWENHGPGMCGLPLLGKVNRGAVIIGLHSASVTATNDYNKKDVSFALPVLKSDLDRAFKLCSEKNVGKDGFEPVNAATEAFTMYGEEPAERSVLRYVVQGPVTYFGKIGDWFGHQKSEFIESPFNARLKDVFNKVFGELPAAEYVPAKMSPSPSGSPITEGFKKLVGQRKPVDRDVMRKSMEQISQKIYDNLIAAGFNQKLQPLDLLTAFNGSPIDYLSKGFTANKAAGFGFKGKKSRWMHRYVDSDGKVSYEPKQALLEEVLKMWRSYESGNCTNPIFKAALKDEIRTLEKYLKNKTRVFYVTPFPFLIMQKMFLGPIYMLMVQYSKAFYTAIGIDMHRHGHIVREDAIKFCLEDNPYGNINILEGDYGGFDTSMPYMIGEGANWIVYDLLKRLGYNKKQLKVVSGIMTDAMYPRVDFWGDLLMVPGLQPSGKYATAEDNSIRNLLIQVYIWNSIPELENKNFFDYVLPCNYGDDVSGGVKDPVTDLYNNIIFEQICGLIGLEFTSSTKSKEMEKFVLVRLMSFLKRTFRYHKDLNRVVSTLSLDSIFKMLQWYAPSKEVNPAVQLKGICDSAIREAFFWLPQEDKFNEFRNYLLEILGEVFPDCTFELPTYWALVNQYKLTDEEMEGIREFSAKSAEVDEDEVEFY